jgi:redox-sensitive bicupin YhaK (pirin superfamily)
VSKHAHIYQRVKATKNLPKGCDEDVLLKPLPLWAPHSDQPVDPPPGPADAKAKPIGEMPRIAARVVLKELQGRKAPVAQADRALLVDLRAAVNDALHIDADAPHNGEAAMVR